MQKKKVILNPKNSHTQHLIKTNNRVGPLKLDSSLGVAPLKNKNCLNRRFGSIFKDDFCVRHECNGS